MKTRIENYIAKTSKHLFTTKNSEVSFKVYQEGSIITIVSFVENDSVRDYTTRTIDIDNQIKYYGKNALNVITHMIFDPQVKHYSIKNRKKYNEIMKKLKQVKPEVI